MNPSDPVSFQIKPPFSPKKSNLVTDKARGPSSFFSRKSTSSTSLQSENGHSNSKRSFSLDPVLETKQVRKSQTETGRKQLNQYVLLKEIGRGYQGKSGQGLRILIIIL